MIKSGWEQMLDEPGEKKHAGHCDRNQGPILEKLLQYLPRCAAHDEEMPLQLLEIASGTGQHAAFMAAALHNVVWQTSDVDPVCVKSTDLWTEGLRPKVKDCLLLDVVKEPSSWPVAPASIDIILNCNMIHLAPIQVMLGFCAGAGVVTRPGGKLFLYGPFTVGGRHTSESNAEFDAKLRARDPSWGVRSVEEVEAELAKSAFSLVGKEEMPANNLLLVFQKAAVVP